MKSILWLLLVVLSTSTFAQIPYNDRFRSSLQSAEQPQLGTIFGDSAIWDDPKKATVLAMALPGAGQIYNKKYWKAAIVYAGLGGLGYMFKYNKDSLDKYQTLYVGKLAHDADTSFPDPSVRSTASIKSDRDFHRRYRDISILGFVGLYALQVIDANVDAHLKEFNVNKDLAMHVSPDILATKPGIGRYTGMTLRLTF